ncbi:MAG: sigma factor regulator FecR [Desulfobacteraceae bacterium]|nr:sigma factor regulator FecR [Desulfobacteraceae bacterium]MBC2755755.1 sigma factor regulator FecR [Desulfobacteraceae bacterium]
MKDLIIQLAEKLAQGKKNVVFTGAGISTESGISDYRSKGGIWDRFKPIYFDEFMSSENARIEYWRRKCELYEQLDDAAPNAAHNALSELNHKGLLELVITQNIDGLHQRAGLPDDKVIELHGNTTRVRCMSCDAIVPLNKTLDRIKSGEPAPNCSCGGYLKPDTISFGQSLREQDLSQAMRASQNCDVFLAIGSTLIVHPASLMPDIAQKQGAFLAIVNLSETPYDKACHLLIKGKAGEVLPMVIQQINEFL